jgi:hypothetical protein
MAEPTATESSPPVKRLSRWGQRAVSLWRLVVAVVLGYRGEALALRAGNLTFITITSLVPVVAVIFSLLHAFNAKRIDPLVLKFFEDILSPGGRAQSEQTIRTFLSAANSRAAGSLSFIVVLVSAGVMLRHLDASLNDIWRVREKRPILVSIALYAAVLFVGPLLIGLSLLGTQTMKQFLGWLEFPFSAEVYFLGSVIRRRRLQLPLQGRPARAGAVEVGAHRRRHRRAGLGDRPQRLRRHRQPLLQRQQGLRLAGHRAAVPDVDLRRLVHRLVRRSARVRRRARRLPR